MFKNILIAEDHQSIKISIEQTLKGLNIPDPQYAYYCDDAFLRIKNGLREKNAYDLLITDLSFEEDGREQKISNGADLIEAAKIVQPELRVLVFSAETNPVAISSLFQKLGINGYVRKGRRDALELKEALSVIYNNKRYVPVEFQQAIRRKNAYDFTAYDIMIVSQLAQGTLQKEIPVYLHQQGVKASSLSSVEKRLNQIKEALGFTKNEQLVAYCKDYKVI
jgi:two-component system capsular synthesis response regulator RcsB